MEKDRVVVEVATPKDFSAVVAMLDQEFIQRKGITLSFASRWPNVYRPSNSTNIYVIKEFDRIVSSVAVKRRKLVIGEQTYHFAMVGGVCTTPHAGGRGLASTVLWHVENRLKHAQIDFAVLWATNSRFYENLGWLLSDHGLFGALERIPKEPVEGTVSYGRLEPADVTRIEKIRARRLTYRVIRQASDYQIIPIPAQTIERFAVQENSEWTAYAIVGRLNDTGYVYEVVGDSASFQALWSTVGEAYRSVYINDFMGSPSSDWLNTHGSVHWTPQILTMWRILSSRLTMDHLRNTFIPFLDRI